MVDRIVVARLGNRLANFETALALADGVAFAENADTGERTVFSASFACPVSGFTIEEIEPRLFSFNNPYGACPACDGLGMKIFSIRSWSCPTSGCRWPTARSRRGPIRRASTTCRRWRASPGTSRSRCDAVARSAGERARHHPVRHRRRAGHLDL